MNIAIINNLYEPWSRGGAEKIAKLQYEGLSTQGHRVITISLRPYFSTINNTNEHYYLFSVFLVLNKIPKVGRLFWHFFDLFNIIQTIKILKILKKEKISTVITHNLTGLGKISAYFIAKRYRHIHVLHDINLLHPSGLMYLQQEKILDSQSAKWYQNINKFFFTKTDVVISPSEWLLYLHIKYNFFSSIKQKKVIANPVEKINFKEKKTSNNNINFIYVGHMAEHKGVGLLLKAWQTVLKNTKIDSCNISLQIIGRAENKKILRQLNDTPQLDYLGELSYKKLVRYYQNADCLIMPSLCYENSPSVIYEAATYGLLIIAANLGGAGELVNALGARVFQAGDYQNLVDEIIWAIKNKSNLKKIGHQSQLLVKKYSLDNYLKKLGEIL